MIKFIKKLFGFQFNSCFNMNGAKSKCLTNIPINTFGVDLSNYFAPNEMKEILFFFSRDANTKYNYHSNGYIYQYNFATNKGLIGGVNHNQADILVIYK